MKSIFVVVFLMGISVCSFSQEIISIDLVKVKKEKVGDALFFFENGWKVLRDSAFRAGAISGYQLLKVENDTSGIAIVLMTRYRDKQQFDRREAFFQPLIKTVFANRTLFQNGFRREDMKIERSVIGAMEHASPR